MSNPEYRLFQLGSNPSLAEEIASISDIPLAAVDLETFADNEIYERIVDSVRGQDVYVIQGITTPVHDNLMRLMVFIDAARRTSARSINVIIPYFGYARSDRKARSREPIVARLIADLLETQGVKRLMAMDLHTSQVQGFFDIPVDHLLATPVQSHYFYEQGLTGDDVVVVSPDPNSLKMVQNFAKVLNANWAIVDAREEEHGQAKHFQITGTVAGKHAILMDDIIDSGRTMAQASQALADAGATKIDALATHPVLSHHAVERLEAAPLDRVIVTNTIEIPAEKRFDKLVELSVAPLFAEGLRRVINHESMAGMLTSPDNPEVSL
ncbi:ribose-phosphate diphosphokinase [Leuconostocaceae bacterium ESL0723]|nr:ribose-phosphate diphosphokinase [Leuconostocaceae bacterium ESL0723]